MKQRLIIEKKQDDLPQDNTDSVIPALAVFIIIATAILFFGLVMLYSTSYVTSGNDFFKKQLVWMFFGLCASAATLVLGAKRLSDWSPIFLIVLAVLLVIARFSKEINGAHRWIILGPVSIQPSEFCKVAITLFMAKFLSSRTHALETEPFKKVLVPISIWVLPVIGLVFLGKDLGTSVLLGLLFLSMLFVAGMRLRYLLPVVLLLPPAALWYFLKFDAMRAKRLTSFLNPEAVSDGAGYQLFQSLLALGSGEWLGLGFGESRLKLKYLPEAHTDFILAVVGEELGFVFLILTILAYLLLVLLGLAIAAKAPHRQNKLIAFGMMTFIAIQAMINIGVICAALPTKGMSAPMISYGGSNLITCMVAISCVVSIGIDSVYPNYADSLLRWAKNRIICFFSSFHSGEKKVAEI